MNFFKIFILAVPFLFSNAYAEAININTASKEDIVKNLKGIGNLKAQAIVEFREKNGDFLNADDLLKVSGIGPKILENIKEDLLFETFDKSEVITKKVNKKVKEESSQSKKQTN